MTTKKRESIKANITKLISAFFVVLGVIILLVSADAFEHGYVTASLNLRHIIAGLSLMTSGTVLYFSKI